MKLTNSYLFLFLLLTNWAIGQTTPLDQLTADPNITWIGETEVNYSFSERIGKSQDYDYKKRISLKSCFGLDKATYNYPHILKVQYTDRSDKVITDLSYENLMHYLPQTVISQVIDKNVTAYSDSECTTPLTEEQIKKRLYEEHMVFKFNNETFQEDVFVTIGPLKSEKINTFRVRQYLYFNKATLEFYSYPTAIAPIKTNYDGRDDCDGLTDPLFWLPVKCQSQKIDLKNSNIVWAAGIERDAAINATKELKNEVDVENSVSALFNAIDKEKINVYLSKDKYYEDRVHYPFDWTDTLVIDTVEVTKGFDPETFDEIKGLARNWPPCEPKEVGSIRLYQEFAWDNEQKTFLASHLGFFPIKHSYNSRGKLSDTEALFFRPITIIPDKQTDKPETDKSKKGKKKKKPKKK